MIGRSPATALGTWIVVCSLMPSRIGIITSVLSNVGAEGAGGVAWARARFGPVAAIASDTAQAIRRDRTTKCIMTRELPSEARNDGQAAIVHRIGRPGKRRRGALEDSIWYRR